MTDNTHLVLSRKKDQSIKIEVPDSNGTATTIYIDIASIGEANVKLGIEAPREVSILRYELIG